MEYYEELENVKICAKKGWGAVFATYGDKEKHEQFHCGNDENGYDNNINQWVIDRRTPYGYGAPNKDTELFKDMAFFNK